MSLKYRVSRNSIKLRITDVKLVWEHLLEQSINRLIFKNIFSNI